MKTKCPANPPCRTDDSCCRFSAESFDSSGLSSAGVSFDPGNIVKITISHNHSKEEVKQSVDRSFNDLFQGIVILPIRFAEERKTWQGNTLTFSLIAKMGLISTPMKGTVEVTDRDLTIDVDLGMLERLIPAAKVRDVVSSRVRGLLK